MPKRLVTLLALSGALLAVTPIPASAQERDRPRALVLWLDATSLEDWAAAGEGPFARMLEGGVATVAAPPPILDPTRAALAAAETVGAGRILRDAPTTDDRPTPLWIALAAFRLEHQLLSGAPDGTPATVARALAPVDDIPVERFARADPQFPGGARTDVSAMARAVASSTADVILAQVPDVLAVERTLGLDADARASWVAQTVERARTVLDAMLNAADDTDLVMVVSPTPPGPRRDEGLALGAVAVAGEGVPAGPLGSHGADGDGLVSLTDIAPTLLAWFGFSRDDVDTGALPRFTDAPPGFAGSAIGSITGDGLARARARETDLIDAARSHATATRGFAFASIALALLAVGTVLSGRGAPPASGRFPHGWRDGLATASIALVLYAPALLLTTALPAALLALAGAIAARATLGRERSMITALATCAALPLADLASGGALLLSSALASPVAHGLRTRAFDPIALGMILAGLPAIGALLDRRPTRDRDAAGPLAFGVVGVFLVGTSGAGGDVGAALALAPAALLLTVILVARLERRAIVAVLAATIAAGGLVTLTFGPTLWVHEDPLIPQRAIPNLVGLRLGVLVDQVTSVWLPAMVVVVGSIALLAARRGALLARGLWGRPFFRAGLATAAIGGAIAVVTVRGGLATAGLTAALLVAAAAQQLLAPEE